MTRRTHLLKRALSGSNKYWIFLFLFITVIACAASFKTIDVKGNITLTGTVDGRDVAVDGGNLDTLVSSGLTSLTSGEVTQLQNIDSTTISTTQWGYLGLFDQGLAQADLPTFAQLNIDNLTLDGNTLSSTSGNVTIAPTTSLVIQDGSEGTIGHVLTSTGILGEANWEEAAGGGGGAASTVLLTQPLRNFENNIGAGEANDGKGQQILIGDDPITVESVGFKVFDNLSSGGTFTFSVRSCNVQSTSCIPASIVATSIATAPSTLGASLPANFVTIDMITPAILAANTWYSVVLDASSVTTSIRVSRRTDNVEPTTQAVNHATGGGWATDGIDYAFELNGTTGSANSYLSNLNDVAINVPLEFGFLIPGLIRTRDNSVGISQDITIQTGTASTTRGDFNIDALATDIVGFGKFELSDLSSNTWGTQLPSLVYDGTTTEALAAFGAGEIFDGDGDQGVFFHFTKDITSGTAGSADNLFYTGDVSGTATGKVGNIEIFTPQNSGPSGGAGKILLFSRDATNSASDGIIELRVAADGNIRLNHAASIGQAGEYWRTKDTLGNGNWENLQGRKVTADPCGDTTNYPESTIFYNDTSNYYCYCDGTNDVQMHSPATACF